VAVVEAADAGFGVALDGRRIRTVGGRAPTVPTRALAEAMAAEWAQQGETIDAAAFILRDLADYAIDVVAQAPATVVGE
ncbi:ATP12 family protein, partial [Acinetobacter baumannii]